MTSINNFIWNFETHFYFALLKNSAKNMSQYTRWYQRKKMKTEKMYVNIYTAIWLQADCRQHSIFGKINLINNN